MTIDMGTKLSKKVVKIFQTRGNRRVFVGTFDKKKRLYQWAPGRETGTVANCSYRGKMSFGTEEWAAIQELGVKLFEFKEGPSGLLYRTTNKIAARHVDFEETPNGERALVPLGCFIVINDKTKEIVRERELS